jgi:hypothetical protein
MSASKKNPDNAPDSRSFSLQSRLPEPGERWILAVQLFLFPRVFNMSVHNFAN